MAQLNGKIQKLFEVAKSLSEKEQRQVAAILGACVADAAARPLHWVYDMSALKSYLSQKTGTTAEERKIDRYKYPEFYPESKSPFYNIPTGENSCYFDISKSVLFTLLARNGELDYNAVCEDFKENFFVKTEYNMKMRQEYMTRRAKGLDLTPINGKWLSGSLIEFIQNYKMKNFPFGGNHIKETDGFCAAMPYVALNSGNGEVHLKVPEIVKTLSTWPTSVSHGRVAAKILEKFILCDPEPVQSVMKEIEREFPDVHRSLSEVTDNLSEDHTKAVGWIFGRPCYNPGSFQGALHSLLTSDNFAEAVRKTIRAGGCCCSRSLFIGSCAGAKYGLDGIPVEWINKTKSAEDVLSAAIDIVKKK